MKRRYAILAPRQFANDAKTAHGVIAYGNDEIVAVIDPECAGQTRERRVCRTYESDAPIVAQRGRRAAISPDFVADRHGAARAARCRRAWRTEVLRRDSKHGWRSSAVCTTCSARIRNSEAIAQKSGASIWDVRKPPEIPIFSGAVYDVQHPTLLMVGNDCAVGKMTVAFELARAARRSRHESRVRADRTNRHHDRRLGHLHRPRHRRFCAGRDGAARTACGGIESGM